MRHLSILCAILLLVLVPGCDDVSTSAPILKPFEGSWRCNADETVKLWNEQGASDEEIAAAKLLIPVINLHPNMKLTGNRAIIAGITEGYYRFYALHSHAQAICGKAWFRNNREADWLPASTVLARLELRNGDLYLSLREHEDQSDPAEPEVTNPPITAGSAITCTADSKPNPPWSPWRTYIFNRVGKL